MRGGYFNDPDDSIVLPDKLPVPPTGRALPITMRKPVGTAGTVVQVEVNHFPFTALNTGKLSAFKVEIKIPVTSQIRGEGQPSVNQLANVLRLEGLETFWGPQFVFNNVSKGWSTSTLGQEVGDQNTMRFELPGHREDRPQQVDVTISRTKDLELRDLVLYLKGNHFDTNPLPRDDVRDSLEFLTAMYRKDPAKRFHARPKSNAYFDGKHGEKVDLQCTNGLLQAWRGLFQSVQIRFNTITMNVDTATTTFWRGDACIIDFFAAAAGQSVPQYLERTRGKPTAQIREGLQERVEGCFCQVRHLADFRNERRFRIKAISMKNADEEKFNVLQPDGSEKEISVFQ